MRTIQSSIFSISTVILVIVLSSCGQQPQDANKTSSKAETPVSPPPPPKPASDLDAQAQDAVDLAITSFATRSSLNPISVSPELSKRLKPYEDGTTFERKVTGVQNSFRDEGSLTKVKPGSKYITKFKGGLNAEVSFIDGTVGLKKGTLYVAENTHAMVNGEKYVFMGGYWKRDSAR